MEQENRHIWNGSIPRPYPRALSRSTGISRSGSPFSSSAPVALGFLRLLSIFPSSCRRRLASSPATERSDLFLGLQDRGQRHVLSQSIASMDEGDIDFANPEVFSGPNAGGDPPSSCSMDSFFDDIFKDTQRHACTHTHTCNPPGRDLSHTHTCFHVHTKILSAPADESHETTESADKTPAAKKRPFGNREAVRKYREKRKAHTASLEDEIVQLRALNQQLMKRLQNQAALEAEVARLRCLLVDIRGRIEGEIGSFPFHKPIKGTGDLVSGMTQGNFLGGAQVVNSCDFRCNDQLYCPRPGMHGKAVGEDGVLNGQVFGGCEIANIQCMGSPSPGSAKFLACGGGNVLPVGCSLNAEKK